VSTPTEAEEWARLATSDDQAALERFIRVYPTGPYTQSARGRLSEFYARSAASFEHGTAREDDVTRARNAPFGAIVIPASSSADGDAAISWNEKTVASATASALRACKARHAACRIAVLYRRNQCAAAAVDGSAIGWAKASSSDEAAAAAIAMCAQKGGVSCTIKDGKCNAASLR
jgi:Domain of unknown function (DUF4189)